MSECENCGKCHQNSVGGGVGTGVLIKAAKEKISELNPDAKVLVMAVNVGDDNHCIVDTDERGMSEFLENLLTDDLTLDIAKRIVVVKVMERISKSSTTQRRSKPQGQSRRSPTVS